ncbi:putative bcl-2/adenovirus E1B 19 kDa-interacting protein 2-like protein [Scophthalmus maximus]|uniref:Putative bcl-2/adenovirus E1B 19 kDa-interacting protein 2-like protein n=1 Tax=Scophthalmus maximus TaxID=52904 RepID=A0A2U9CYU1_SCOMX|nr:putative bcl-2/adenovirus E1B 19 kDa-interacting protein 2-like protein [Scophthalmus maximus]
MEARGAEPEDHALSTTSDTTTDTTSTTTDTTSTTNDTTSTTTDTTSTTTSTITTTAADGCTSSVSPADQPVSTTCLFMSSSCPLHVLIMSRLCPHRGEELTSDLQPGATEEESSTRDRPDRPSSLPLSSTRPVKKKVLVAPPLSLSLGRSESTVSDDFLSGILSPAPEDDDDTGLDFDLDAMETPSDTESLHFPVYDLDLEGERSRSDSVLGLDALEREDVLDAQGTRWRCFSSGEPLHQSRVNMSVLQPFLRVLSHGGYYGDGMNDIIVFSSCYLPQNRLENYQHVMDNLFRYVVGTLDLMVAENYVMVYLCAGGQKDKLPEFSWLRECYTTIDRRLRKNLKFFYVVHPTWYIKALITIIKPFISSKFSRKLRFINSLQELSDFLPTEHVQIPDCVRQYDQSLTR